MKAILIARVSTEEQKEAGNSLPAQMIRLEKYCQNKDFQIIKNFSFDESAYKNLREEFDAILDFVITYPEKIVVCCDKVDRLSRNIFDKRISTLYEKALNDEVELHFVSDGQIINSSISAVEKFQFGISLGLAKYYSDAISDNVKRAIEQKLRKGEWPAKAPYGYKNITLSAERTDIIIDEFAAQIIQKAFELYSTGAYSMALLAQKMKADHGIVWSVSYIDKIFNNHFYYGMMLVKGNMYPHRYPPIISKALFEQVQNVKKSYNKKNRFKLAGKPYIYRGLIRCADCNLAITPEKHKGHIYYHCTQYNGKHGAKWLREEEITRQLADVFTPLQMPKDILEQTAQTLTELHEHKIEFQTKQFDELTKQHKMLTKMMDNLYMDKLKGRITESEYDKFYQSFRDQITDVSIKLERLQEAENNYYITTKYLLELSSKAYDLFIGSEVEEKRQLIKLILSNVKLNGEKLVYEPQKPFDLLLECSENQVWRALMDNRFFHSWIESISMLFNNTSLALLGDSYRLFAHHFAKFAGRWAIFLLGSLIYFYRVSLPQPAFLATTEDSIFHTITSYVSITTIAIAIILTEIVLTITHKEGKSNPSWLQTFAIFFLLLWIESASITNKWFFVGLIIPFVMSAVFLIAEGHLGLEHIFKKLIAAILQALYFYPFYILSGLVFYVLYYHLIYLTAYDLPYHFIARYTFALIGSYFALCWFYVFHRHVHDYHLKETH